MKLVHVISSLEQGGAQAVLYALVQNIAADHHVIFIHEGPYRNRFETLNIPVYQIKQYQLLRLIQLLQQIKPDCLHTSLWIANWLGRIAAWWCGVPCICSLHNHKDLNGAIRNLLDRCVPHADTMIAVSHAVKSSFAYTNTMIIENGIAVYRGPHKTKQDLGLHETDFVIGSVGRFHPDKQYDLLLKAFSLLHKKIANARLLLIGSGPEKEKLYARAQQLKVSDSVLFLGGVDARPYYTVFDCFILTSKNEGVSLALLEAMSAGVLSICAHTLKNHAVISHNQNGFLVAHDEKAIAELLRHIYQDIRTRKQIAQAGRTFITKKFDQESMIQKYVKLINGCLKS